MLEKYGLSRETGDMDYYLFRSVGMNLFPNRRKNVAALQIPKDGTPQGRRTSCSHPVWHSAGSIGIEMAVSLNHGHRLQRAARTQHCKLEWREFRY